jgi:hypothetical protein
LGDKFAFGPFFFVFVNWLKLGHVEGWVGYQHHWKLQGIQNGVGFVNDFLRVCMLQP